VTLLPIAHGIGQRSDLPIPRSLFYFGAAMVLVVSFVALALLWTRPQLEGRAWRPLPGGLGRALASKPVEIACGAIGVFLLGIVIWSGLEGEQVTTLNLAPNFVYIAFWVGLVPASVLFGDVFRAFNPWRALGRAVAWVASRAAGGSLPAPLAYPERLGRWPAVIALLLFAWMELANPDGDVPRNVAIAAFVYSAVTFVGMALYGVSPWIDRAEGFSVYFNLFSRLSPFERRGDELGVRRPLSGLASLDPQPGTVPLLAVMIGTVTFDGGSEGSFWQSFGPDMALWFQDRGLGPDGGIEAAYTIGIAGAVLLILGFYLLGSAGARAAGEPGEGSRREGTVWDFLRVAKAFVHSLVPIAFAYVAAHYVTLLLFDGQSVWRLISDPLGRGDDHFGTADTTIDQFLGGEAIWYIQVGLVVAGHVAAIVLAHDRALALYDRATVAMRSQYAMLGVMIGFTNLALWLLSQANA
jgi:hypothetical protein